MLCCRPLALSPNRRQQQLCLASTSATDAEPSSSTSTTSFIPETLKQLEADTEFQATLAAYAQKGQQQLTREESRARKRSLQHLNLPAFGAKLQVCSAAVRVGGSELENPQRSIVHTRGGVATLARRQSYVVECVCHKLCAPCHHSPSLLAHQQQNDRNLGWGRCVEGPPPSCS